MPVDLGRVVALVGDPDQRIAEADGTDDLRRRRKEARRSGISGFAARADRATGVSAA